MTSKNSIPAALEFGQLRSYLAKIGVSQAQIKEWAGDKGGDHSSQHPWNNRCRLQRGEKSDTCESR